MCGHTFVFLNSVFYPFVRILGVEGLTCAACPLIPEISPGFLRFL